MIHVVTLVAWLSHSMYVCVLVSKLISNWHLESTRRELVTENGRGLENGDLTLSEKAKVQLNALTKIGNFAIVLLL